MNKIPYYFTIPYHTFSILVHRCHFSEYLVYVIHCGCLCSCLTFRKTYVLVPGEMTQQLRTLAAFQRASVGVLALGILTPLPLAYAVTHILHLSKVNL